MRLFRKPILAALPIFLVSWFIYARVVPVVMVSWKITGDEPHYLLAAQSLVSDGDLDLKNNYQNRDYVRFYSGDFLDPHIFVESDGTWLLAHDIGLPIILAPAYAAGGRSGVLHFLAFMGGLMAAQLFLVGWEVSGRWWAGLLGWLSLAFSAPLALYVFQIYPELIGGLFVLFASRHILGTPAWLESDNARPALAHGRWALVVAAVTALPWLSGRYIPVLLWLTGLLIWKHWPRRRLWSVGGGLALASLAAYLTVNYRLFDGPTPSTTPSGNAVAAGFTAVAGQQIWRGLAGWPLDQQRGLLIYGPVLIVALIGVPHQWNLRRLDGVLLWIPLILTWLLASVWGGFYIGWEISARFLIVGLPLTAGGIAAAAVRIRNVAFWPLAAGLLTLSVLNTALVLAAPFYAFHESPVKLYEQATGWPLRNLLPALGTRSIIAPADGSAAWQAAAGESKYLSQTTLSDLSLGWYVIRGQAQLTRIAQPGAPAVRVEVFSSESGAELAQTDIPANSDEPVVDVNIPFYNPYYNKWDFPLFVDVRTTGAAEVRLSYLLFEPDPGPTYGRAVAWMIGLSMLTVVFADKKSVRSRLSRLFRLDSRLESAAQQAQ